MERKPITRPRSKWVPKATTSVGVPAKTFERRVHDGVLYAILAKEPAGWHLSVSHQKPGKRKAAPRYPTWDELADARYALMPDDIDVVMHLPPTDEYVAVHDTTFHLHEKVAG